MTTKSNEIVTDSEIDADDLSDKKTKNNQSITNENSKVLKTPRKMKNIEE